MPDVLLLGCRPDTAAGYLKALGVLRLVAEQRDSGALGWWRGDGFVLVSSLDVEDLTHFLLEAYRPSPILAPWNKDSGFYRRGAPLEAIERSDDPRFVDMRNAIGVARALLDRFGWEKQPGKERDKARFLTALRAELPDPAIRWLDAVVALADVDPAYAPLFGIGGVDGRFEVTRVFAECLIAALDIRAGRRARRSARTESALGASLFAAPEPDSTIEATGGLLAPASGDAPNAAPGFLGSKRLNPWDLILAIEGALMISGSVTRRHGSASGRLAVFPFTVEPAGAGHASAGSEGSRGEIWLPLWTRPAGFRELLHLFREGRAEWRRRQATSAVDMARAIASLGVDRGLSEFRRFGVQKRFGRTHLVVPLGRWPVVERSEVHLLAELDTFLASLRFAAQRKDAPTALVEVSRELEEAIMDHAAYGGRERLAAVLVTAARAELTLARRPGTRPKGLPRPLSGLSGSWRGECDDGSVEFELAAAVSSLRPGERGPGEFRRHLEPVERRGSHWVWSDGPRHEVVWTGRDALRDMGAVLERRIVDAEREGVPVPLDGMVRAHPRAIGALLRGEVAPDRLARLIEALALIDGSTHQRPVTGARYPPAVLPASYALIKLTLLGTPLRVGGEEIVVRPDPMVLGLLRAGNVWEATLRAARRLRTAGVTPKGIPMVRPGPLITRDREAGRRLLAALLVPTDRRPLLRAIGHAEAAGAEERSETKGEAS
ncbi:MAG TPA: type I-U CRISPR-associated protein Csx17 [bacterium]|nr:type I-U CRISPR-associated protein Csx17 [bacterium]